MEPRRQKHRPGRRAVLPLAALLLASAAAADELPSITWIHPYTRGGVYDPAKHADVLEDNVLDWFIDRLPGYRQSVTTATVRRLMELLRSVDGTCYATLRKTPEREAFIEFSDPLFWSMPERLVVLDRNLKRFQPYLMGDGAVSLAGVLDDPGLKGPRERERVFSPPVEAMLKAHEGTDRLVDVPKAVDVYAMLATGHLDWLVGYATDAKRNLRSAFPDAAYRTLAIDGSDEPFEVFAGCSKREEGVRIIADIDRLLREKAPRDALQELYDRWIDDDARAALHRFIMARVGQ